MANQPTLSERIINLLVTKTPEAELRELAIDASLHKALEVGGEGQERPAAESGTGIVDQSTGNASNRVPGREEIKVGPTQAASGGNAERQIREYSEPAPQQDIVMAYERVSDMLGDIGKALKALATSQAQMVQGQNNMATAFAEIIKKAEEEEDEGEEQTVNIAVEESEEEEDEEEGSGKSLPASMRAYFQMVKADLLAKAEEEEEDEEEEEELAKAEDEEEEEEEAEKALSPTSRLNMAKAMFMATKAAADEKVAKASRRRLRRLVEKSVVRAWLMAKKAEAQATKEANGETDQDVIKALLRTGRKAKAMANEISEYAFLKEIKLRKAVKKPAPLPKADATGDIEKDEEEHNQDKWATSTGKGSPTPGIEDVLKGNAVLNGNIMKLFEVLSGKGSNMEIQSLPGLVSKAAGGDPSEMDPATLMKSNPAVWAMQKQQQIDAARDSGELQLADELAASTILQHAEAARQGIISENVLKARVGSSSEAVRALFREVLDA